MTMTETPQTVDLEQTLNAPEPTQTAPEAVTPEADAQAPEAKPEPTPEDDAERAKRSMQRRIDKRTADLYRERAQNEQLTQRLSALEARVGGEPEQHAGQVDPVALAREIAAIEKINDKSNAIAKDGEKRFPGEFRESLTTVAEEAGSLFEPSGRATALGDAILDSDDPAALLHYLGKNPDLAADLQGLSAAALGRRIGRIEAQMTAKPADKPVSKAPDPARPISAQRSTGNLANASMDEYVAMRKAQGAKWAR